MVFDFSTDPRVVLRLLTQRPEHPVSVHYLIPETVAILFALIEKYRPELLDDLLAVAEQKNPASQVDSDFSVLPPGAWC
ncbi:MAG: hypothetical protein IIB76_10685 [Proteobacteria bacterium]|nr:hypothetical protein [Pseudomonadota bacterium]